MTQAVNLERLLDDFLAEGPRLAPDRVVDQAMAQVGHIAQVGDRRAVVSDRMSRFVGLAAAAVLLVAVTAAIAFVASRNSLGGPTIVPIPPPSPSASPSRASSLVPRPTSDGGAPVSLPLGTEMMAGTTYTIPEFDPAFTIAGIPGWQLNSRGPSIVNFQAGGDAADLTIIRPSQAIDSFGNVIPLPAGLADWFIAQPELHFDRSGSTVPPTWDPSPITVGGANGVDLGSGSIVAGTQHNSRNVVNVLCSFGAPCNRDATSTLGMVPGRVFSLVVLSVNGTVVVLGMDALPEYTDVTFQTFERSLHFTGSAPTALVPGTVMEAGKTYVTSTFVPGFTIGGEPGWRLSSDQGETSGRIVIQSPDGQADVTFIRPSQVVDDKGVVGKLPGNVVEWLIQRGDLAFDSGWIWSLSPVNSLLPPTTELGGATGTDFGGGVLAAGASTNAQGEVNLFCSSDAPCSPDATNQLAVSPGKPFSIVALEVNGQMVVMRTESDANAALAAHDMFGQLEDSLHFLP